MKSKWKVRTQSVASAEFFQVYRTTDAAKVTDRIETTGGLWSTEEEAQALARRLNTEEVIK